MLDSFIVIGLVMVIVDFLKTFWPFTTKRGKLLISLLVFAVAGTLNVINAAVFGGAILSALKEGFVIGAVASGIYSMGKAAMSKTDIVEALPPAPNVTYNNITAKETEQKISGL